MKKSLSTLFMTLTAVLALNASNVVLFHGTTTVTSSGNSSASDEGGVTLKINDNGLDTLAFHVIPFGVGSIGFDGVQAATSGDVTVYSAERDIQVGFTTEHATLFARIKGEYMTAVIYLSNQDVVIEFDNVGDHFQLPNSDMESWTNSNGEPDRWHGFKTAGGTFASTSAGIASLGSSDDVRPGTTGHSAVLTAGSFFNIVANGTMTNGKLMAGSYEANSPLNHAEMDKANGTDDFYMPLYAKPDKFNVWLKYTQGTTNANNKANVSVKTFDGTYYQEPTDKTYTNLSGSIVGGSIAACDWTHFSFDFDYDSYAANGAATEAIFVTFSTNGNPGSGSKNDAVYVDDMELVYLGNMTDLRYKGQTISGWNPAVTAYEMEIDGEPNLDDFTATIEGVSAVLTKSMEKNQDGSYRIAISVVAADLQTAACYIITTKAPAPQFLPGDVNNDGSVNISDVTALIDILLASNSDISNPAADVNQDGSVNISDVTALIDMLLTSN